MEGNYGIIIGTGIMLIMAFFIILFVVFYQRKQMFNHIREKRLEMDFQRKLLEISMASIEAERRRIAQDLHDDVGALLSVTKLTFNALHSKLGSPTEADKLVTQVRESLDETISHVRRISRELIPTTLDRFGLVAALQEFASRTNVNPNLKLTFNYIGDENCRLESRLELMLYRVGQELINNALKHADATEIHINLSLPPNSFELIVEDNGKGFDIMKPLSTNSSGLGISNIEGRLNIIDGTINYETAPMKGCRAIITLKNFNSLDKNYNKYKLKV